MPSPAQQRAYADAGKIADTLLSRGVPVIGFAGDQHAIHMFFQLEDEAAKYAARLHLADASADRFQELYEAMK